MKSIIELFIIIFKNHAIGLYGDYLVAKARATLVLL